MVSRTVFRAALAAVVVLSALTLVAGQQTAGASSADASGVFLDGEGDSVPPANGTTVIATDSSAVLADEGDTPRTKSELVAFNPDGSTLYYNSTYNRYWDVDPSPEGEYTVLYTASMHLDGEECSATTVCTRNVVERANLSTGETERLYSRITPHKHSTRWHDVDRVNETHYAVADIYRDRVFVFDVETGLTTWEWEAQQEFSLESGGEYPRDWTHVNDVEVLDDGRLMVSLRNQDRVVFLDPQTGLQENWTLGAEDDYDTLYEQHNPDYIPENEGGPAVLVADSENNRVVEYQRENGTWNRTWQWQDARMQWVRDADRLPNGHTLISDSNGNRVFEIDRNGEIVWQADVAFPYESERLETGDESSGGESAASLGLPSRTVDDTGGDDKTLLTSAWLTVRSVVPGSLLNGIVYLVPGWMGPIEAGALVALVVVGVGWAVLEWRWSPYRLRLQSPARLRRK
ncbi:arylsulfotransferase family protein [Haloprofundus salilacus]|uniref:arylsulfotransferase family protein n=1 Tax=Haloprofundus salilacus TaxID=2876190 RepID=UPI001CCA2F5F|nr:arylsulfotransferase family protein [Haloprofundus salilacus]